MPELLGCLGKLWFRSSKATILFDVMGLLSEVLIRYVEFTSVFTASPDKPISLDNSCEDF